MFDIRNIQIKKNAVTTPAYYRENYSKKKTWEENKTISDLLIKQMKTIKII